MRPTLWPDFLGETQTEHRAQSTANPCGVNLWPDYLKKNRAQGFRVGRYQRISLIIMESTANPCGAQYVSFVENHEEHSESVCGPLCGPIFLEKNRQSTVNLCGALSVNFLDNHGERSKSVWGAICAFRWKSEEHREFVWGTLWPDFLEKEQTEHRAQQIRVGRNLWPEFLEKEQSTRGISVGRYLGISLIITESTANPCGAQYKSFVENHEEHSESV